MHLGSSVRSRRVLLVDGDSRTTRRLAELLAQDGYEVDVARSAVEALSRMARSPEPDTLVTELTLPAGDGASVARSARLRVPSLRVIVVTRHVNAVVPQSFGEPLPVVLPKPLDYDRFLGILAGHAAAEEAPDARPASPRI